MKVTSVSSALYFNANPEEKISTPTNTTAQQEKSNKSKKNKYVDPLAHWPIRGLGYTNDIGIAINELAPAAARLFWVPALMYFGADIYDKYKNKGDKFKPNPQRGLTQAVFQAFASIILPAVFGHIGMSAFSQLDKYKGEKLSTNAKEQTLRFIKSHSSLNEITESGEDEGKILSEFTDNFNKFYKAKKKSYNNKNVFVKLYDKLLSNCKRGAIANSDEVRIKAYAREQFLDILHTCSDNEVAKTALDKKIFKLKAWKSAGAFTAILLTAKAIDSFVEKIIIKKFVKPQMDKLSSLKYDMKSFGDKNKKEA